MKFMLLNFKNRSKEKPKVQHSLEERLWLTKSQGRRDEMIKCYHFWCQRYLAATQTALVTRL